MDHLKRVFVVAGPSGAGKDTLIRKALEKVDDIYFSVSATTREPREGEVDGVDYHFLSDGEFEELVEKDAFLEWEEVFGRRYGTLKSEVEKAAASGRNILLELDYKGALNVKSKVKDAILVFVMPPSLMDLESRLKGRDTDREEEIKERTGIARQEIEVGKTRFDVIIVNDDASRAADELARVLRGEKA